jgi:hypothetical protein
LRLSTSERRGVCASQLHMHVGSRLFTTKGHAGSCKLYAHDAVFRAADQGKKKRGLGKCVCTW